MNKIFSVAVWCFSFASVSAFAGPNVLFLLDISGSMAYPLPKIAKAIQEQSTVISAASGRMGVVTTSGCGSTYTQYVVPLAKANGEEVRKTVAALKAGGAEDLLDILKFAKVQIEKLLKETGECANVILFTDDMDTCNGGNKHLDIVRSINAMCSEKEKDFKLDVVTSTVDSDIKIYLDEISKVGDGKVHNAGTIDEINETVRKIVEGYTKTKVGTPLTSTQKKPEGTVTGTPVPKAVPAPQQKQAPAQSGGKKDEKKEN